MAEKPYKCPLSASEKMFDCSRLVSRVSKKDPQWLRSHISALQVPQENCSIGLGLLAVRLELEEAAQIVIGLVLLRGRDAQWGAWGQGDDKRLRIHSHQVFSVTYPGIGWLSPLVVQGRKSVIVPQIYPCVGGLQSREGKCLGKIVELP